MKKIVFLISLIFATYAINAQVPSGQRIGVILNDKNMGDDVTVQVTYTDFNGDTQSITSDIITLTSDNFNENNHYFTDIVGSDVDYTLGTNYKFIIEDTEIKINSVPFATVAQYPARTDFSKDYIKILHNGDYLYVDTAYFENGALIDTFNTYIDPTMICGDVNKKLPSLIELKSISNQIYKFKTSTNTNDIDCFIIDETEGRYWFKNDDNTYGIYNILTNNIITTETSARAKCIYTNLP